MIRSLVFALGVCLVSVNCAAISSNEIPTSRITTSEQLITTIIDDCFNGETVVCLKGKVLTYLDTILGLKEEQARAYNSNNVDKVIFDRVARVMKANEFKFQLPQLIFGPTAVTYRVDQGLDIEIKEQDAARGLLKKKLMLPVLLLLKLKMKALMPIFVAIIGLKAMKALILSKLAITLVLGFIIMNLLKKTGMAMPMSMMPMMGTPPAEPMPYGPPSSVTTPATPDNSYGPAAWDPPASSYTSGSYTNRVWEPSSASSSHNLAYSSYYPSSSSSNSGVATSSSSSNPGSSSSSAPAAHAY